jgi:hypothetical protein
MIEDSRGARITPLADCPYCAGEGTDPEALLGLCRHCYGTGRVARFFAERTLARWARAGLEGGYGPRPAAPRGGGTDDGIEDEVPPRYT